MSEQNCAARKALEEYAKAENWKCPRCGGKDSCNCPMTKWKGACPCEEGGYDLAREALAAPCEHQISEGRRDALLQKSDELREEWQRAENAEAERDQLRAELEKAQALNHRWNRAASQHGPCGSEFHDDPERVFARVLEARQFASEIARVKAEKRAELELRELRRDKERLDWLEPFGVREAIDAAMKQDAHQEPAG